MAWIKGDNEQEQKYFDFLEDLRQSGDANMYGATPYLTAAFRLGKENARAILAKWMKAHGDPSKRLDGPSTAKKTTAKYKACFEVESESR